MSVASENQPSTWPPFAYNWPRAESLAEGLRGRVLRGELGHVVVMAADRDVIVPRHRHGAQWGIVLAGEMELTIEGNTYLYGRGDVHFIPGGVEHEALLRAGWEGVYFFERTHRDPTARGGG